MSNAVRTATFVIAVALIPSIGVSRASGRCIGPKDAHRAREASDAVFSGTVVSVKVYPRDRWADVTVDVDRIWKGDVRRRELVAVGPLQVDANVVGFVPNEKYLIFAVRSTAAAGPGQAWTFSVPPCSQSRLRDAKDALKELGHGHRPRR